MVVVPGNHDSRNVGYVHFEELFGARNSVLRKNGVTVVAVDSTEPDLDHGQIGRGRYGWIEEEFAAEPADLKVFVLHHHLLPIPGTGRERNVVYDAGDAIECLQRAGANLVLSGPQARAVRVEARGALRGQHRHGFDDAAEGQYPTLLQHDRGLGIAYRDLAALSVPRPGANHPVRHPDRRVREVHRAGSRTRCRLRDEGRRSDRRGALPAGRPRRTCRAPVRVDGRDPGWRHREVAGRGRRRHRGLRGAAGRRLRRRGDRRRPLRRAGARACRAVPLGLPRARGRPDLCRRRLPVRPAGVRAVSASLAGGDRHRQARRQDGGQRACRSSARPRPVGGGGCDGARGAGRAGGDRPAADDRGSRRALAGRTARGVRPSRARRADRHHDDRLPPCGRRARGRRVHVERLGGRSSRGRARPRRRRLRRQWRRDPADRHDRADPRRRRRGTTPTRTSTTTGDSSRISSSRSAGTSRARCESTCGSRRRSR